MQKRKKWYLKLTNVNYPSFLCIINCFVYTHVLYVVSKIHTYMHVCSSSKHSLSQLHVEEMYADEEQMSIIPCSHNLSIDL